MAQIRIEAERADLDLIMAENEQAQVWLELAAVVGNPSFKPARLVGELEMAEREVQRVELSLRTRFASAYRSYLNALRIASQYEKQIVPQAQNAYDTALR